MQPGDVLLSDVFNDRGIFLLKKGCVLTDTDILHLENNSIVAVSVSRPEQSPGTEYNIIFEHATTAIKSIFEQVSEQDNLPMQNVESLAFPLVSYLYNAPSILYICPSCVRKIDIHMNIRFMSE
ncbi:hypothetical protein skT53_11810 [Effusibacillus dendaii]|uniref:Uncharacterized protein n=1 Tax=Effusibacillus dendaii TaxID=2743772 RepID=A0A7I8DBH4_9BACL|nr:hypothetical protein skT53_11810 [Effusibacillus dendaii]